MAQSNGEFHTSPGAIVPSHLQSLPSIIHGYIPLMSKQSKTWNNAFTLRPLTKCCCITA